MKDILKNAQELRRFYDYYRAQLNGSRNLVLVHSGDVSLIQRHLDQLHQKTRFISPTMSAELADIRQYLFVAQGPGIYIFNISKFGALGVVLRYLQSEEFTCDIARYICTPWQDINDVLRSCLSMQIASTQELILIKWVSLPASCLLCWRKKYTRRKLSRQQVEPLVHLMQKVC